MLVKLSVVPNFDSKYYPARPWFLLDQQHDSINKIFQYNASFYRSFKRIVRTEKPYSRISLLQGHSTFQIDLHMLDVRLDFH